MQDACDVEQLIVAHNRYLSDAVKLCDASPAVDGEAVAVTGCQLDALLRVCQDLLLMRCVAGCASHEDDFKDTGVVKGACTLAGNGIDAIFAHDLHHNA